ncbi:GH3 auxin-responsive promoter family protein [Paracrocinitomix mangrovi]|uniref:GH3 family domain-containing protein n=1 Tax=Paracrocinitomix mangrovi TaxID=2862509 RepID=UPI001C8E21D0|nr:GH3 auxin-responsive promoter family protein [Paracrocinitomix mangrovi]UKN00773.1 GH3 auxin-responsive promoter family protein [Paracrocinitomix mangrovi]
MIVGTILKGASSLAQKKNNKKSQQLTEKMESVVEKQEEVLTKLLSKAKKTEFGEKFNFTGILKSENIREAYRQQVPIFQYDLMFKQFWCKTLEGKEDVTWPGKISNFALTSGTTSASSKRIPVSKQMIKSIKKVCLKQAVSLADLKFPTSFYEKDVLFVGGSTDLTKINSQWEGDLSGILTGKVPHWLNPYSKPSKKIRAISDWEEKLEMIVDNAHKWDVGMVCGVPAWVQILLNRIVEKYELKDIFEIWPDLRVYIHGGVSFDPYEKSFNELLGGKVVYLDTYLASEGFIGFQKGTEDYMQLVFDANIYFEFIPFNADHFDEDGNLMNFSDALTVDEIEEGKDYALLISTNSGSFRYLIGDTIQFVDAQKLLFRITGRTKHFLSMCGEHLSVDNMTQAISDLSYRHNIAIEEFAVLGKETESGNFMHKWFIASDSPINALQFKEELDEKLKELNDDYITERKFALERIELEVLPTDVFYNFLKLRDKYGSQHKFPRVMKGQLASDWEKYIHSIAEEYSMLSVYEDTGAVLV